MLTGGNTALLVDELRKLPSETEWVEFKENNDDPIMIGKDISALANSAAYRDASSAYLVWGVDDVTHEVVGTSFDYRKARRGGEELENWLHHQLSSNASFSFSRGVIDGYDVVVLEIAPAVLHTVDFESFAYIRIGSYTKKLHDYPAVETAVWNKITKAEFETMIASSDLHPQEALGMLDYPKYFTLLGIAMPQGVDELLHYLREDGLIVSQDNGLYAITNLGALLLAHDLSRFPTVSRKAARIIQYEGGRRTQILKERVSRSGYASDFESVIEFVMALLPSREVIGAALRTRETTYPEIAIRELAANSLIHQDLSLTGSGPVIEIFDNRIEFTNPGESLVSVLRLLDNPPRSRNQRLASLMRRFGICEELGTGWDKVIDACERDFLPAPKVTLYAENGGSMRVTLMSYLPYDQMAADDRVMACYWHACLCFAGGEAMSNRSLRARFGDLPSTSTISRLLRDAVDRGLIKPVDPNTAPRYMRYAPVWA